MDCFDRKIELAEGLETEHMRVLYYDFPHYYKDWYYSYEYYRICTVLRGEKTVEIDRREGFTYDKDQFIILPPESRVSMEMSVPTNCLVFEVSDKLIETISNKVCDDLEINNIPIDKKVEFVFRENTELIRTDLDKISWTALSNNSGKEFLVDLYGQEMVFKILSSAGAKGFLHQNPGNPVSKAIRIMKNNYRENLNIREIASSLYMSPALFSMKFKKITGMSPNAYFTCIKLNKAKEILKHHSVTETSFDLGYDSISHFIKLFTNRFGLTPKQYQIQELQKTGQE